MHFLVIYYTINQSQVSSFVARGSIKYVRHTISGYGNTGCGVQTGGTKLERFLHRNQHTQRKLLNFEFWINGELSKINFIKKCAPKLIFFNEKKKLRKIRIIFGIENWLWKSNFGTFWHLLINSILKIQ